MKYLIKPFKYYVLTVFMLFIGLLYSTCFAMIDGTGFFVIGKGAWIQQIDEDTAYTLLDAATPTDPPNGKLKRNEPGYKFSGGATLGYLAKNHFDISVSFFINDHTSSSSASAAESGVNHLDPVLTPGIWIQNTADTATSRYKYRTNYLSLIFGQWLNLNRHIHLHPYLGIHALRLQSQENVNYLGLDNINFFPAGDGNIIENSSVRAIGPLIGTGISWNLYKAISLEGDFSFILSTGHLHAFYTATATNPENETELSDTKIRSKTNRQIFEIINFQLGLGVHKKLTQNLATQVIAGYKLSKHIEPKEGVPNPFLLSTGLSQYFFSDSGFSGPFLSLEFRLT